MSQLIIGLTGGIGSGKSAAADAFAELGIDIIDADIIARDIVLPGTPALLAIADKFGPSVLLANGQLDRAKLRDLVFSHSEHKDWLNQLLHPIIREQMLTQCQQATSPYCILVVPLLIENGLDKLVNKVVVVDVEENTQLERASQRDDNTKAQIQSIMAAQASRQQRLTHADWVLDNNADLAQLEQQVEKLHQSILATIL